MKANCCSLLKACNDLSVMCNRLYLYYYRILCAGNSIFDVVECDFSSSTIITVICFFDRVNVLINLNFNLNFKQMLASRKREVVFLQIYIFLVFLFLFRLECLIQMVKEVYLDGFFCI